MRVTIDLDEGILRVAKDLAQERQESIGRVVSDLVRRGIERASGVVPQKGVIPVLPRRPGAEPVNSLHVNDLLEGEENR